MTTAINSAFMKLTRRAERNDPTDLVATFVNAGPVFDLLSTPDHQILYGRRGTGKTHLLQYLAEQRISEGDIAVYVDLRTVGSNGGIYTDPGIPITERGTRLLCDVLQHIYNAISSSVLEIAYSTDQDFTTAIRMLDQLADSIGDVRVSGNPEQQITEHVEDNSRSGDRAAVALSSAGPAVDFSATSAESHTSSSARQVRVSGPLRHRVHFGAVAEALGGIAGDIPGRLWLILDEWSDVPLDLQPLLADLLRRCVMPVRDITVKIGAIEQRSNFSVSDGVGGYVGFELGPDISVDVDLDDFMVFGNDNSRAKAFFGELLFRHVSNLTNDDEVSAASSATELIRIGFTQRTAFDEFVRAAEGVPRDAINIAILAAQNAGDSAISVPIVRNAARQWYQRDKERSVQANEQAIELLLWIIDEVIGQRKARAFLLRQGSSSRHSLIEALYDARVLHVIKRGVSARDQPGVRFDVYTLDFGCYVHLSSTASEPEGLFEIETEEGSPQFVEVPVDDYRSIRRAVLDLDDFESRART